MNTGDIKSMTEIYLCYNEQLLDSFSDESLDKAIRVIKNGMKFDVIINNDNGRYIFEVKLDEAEWKLKKDVLMK